MIAGEFSHTITHDESHSLVLFALFFFCFQTYAPGYVDSARMFAVYCFCYNDNTKKQRFLNVIGSEYILMFIIGALNSLYYGVVYIDALKAILTALWKCKHN
jgi:hypothetical protein